MEKIRNQAWFAASDATWKSIRLPIQDAVDGDLWARVTDEVGDNNFNAETDVIQDRADCEKAYRRIRMETLRNIGEKMWDPIRSHVSMQLIQSGVERMFMHTLPMRMLPREVMNQLQAYHE